MSWIADVITHTTILSTWGNSIRDRVVQTFDSLAEANTHLSVPDGALMRVPTVDRHLYQKQSGAWVPATPAPLFGALANLFPAPGITPGTTAQLAAMTVPAGYQCVAVWYEVYLAAGDTVSPLRAQLKLFSSNGGTQLTASTFAVPGAGSAFTVSTVAPVNPAGDRITSTVGNVGGTQNLVAFKDLQNHRMHGVAYGAPPAQTPGWG